MLGEVIIVVIVHSTNSGHINFKFPSCGVYQVDKQTKVFGIEYEVLRHASETLSKNFTNLFRLLVLLFGIYVLGKLLISRGKPFVQRLNILIGWLFRLCGSKSKGYEVEFKCTIVGAFPHWCHFYFEPVYLLTSKAALISSLTPISYGFVLDELVIFLENQEESLGDFSINCFIKVELIAAVWIKTTEVIRIDTHGLL